MHRKDVITAPKTPKSVRTIVIPSFLVDEVINFMKCIPDLHGSDRLVPATKSFLHHEMNRRGTKAAGVKRIRIHDLRHSHVSLLIELGYSALAIADRLRHESTEATMRYAHLFPNKQDDMADGLEVQRGSGMSTLDETKALNNISERKRFECQRRIYTNTEGCAARPSRFACPRKKRLYLIAWSL